MGLSMAIDLGVHLDGTKIGAMNHDPMETEVRKRLYWSSYLVGLLRLHSLLATSV